MFRAFLLNSLIRNAQMHNIRLKIKISGTKIFMAVLGLLPIKRGSLCWENCWVLLEERDICSRYFDLYTNNRQWHQGRLEAKCRLKQKQKYPKIVNFKIGNHNLLRGFLLRWVGVSPFNVYVDHQFLPYFFSQIKFLHQNEELVGLLHRPV